jgi:hypothetical protein
MRLPVAHSAFGLLGTGAVLTALSLGGCARVPSQSASMAASPEVAVSASQLQLQAFEMGRNLSMIIEQAADSIQVASTDPSVKRNALLLKISAIPLVQEAALRNDPHVASVDLWAFTVQLSDYLTTGSGRTSFGTWQPIAVASAADAERAAMKRVSGSMESGQLPATAEATLRKWAANHPMQGPALRRASILDSDWKALGFSDNSFMATVGNVDRTLVNISYRLSYLNETLAAEARWNGELAAQDAMRAPRVDSLLTTSGSALRSVSLFVDSAPNLIDSQRIALMRDIDLQRVAMMRDIDRQRVLAFSDLDAQREALQAALTAERTATLQSADSIVQRSLERAGAVAQRLALEMTLAALLVVVALFVGGSLLVNRWRATAA